MPDTEFETRGRHYWPYYVRDGPHTDWRPEWCSISLLKLTEFRRVARQDLKRRRRGAWAERRRHKPFTYDADTRHEYKLVEGSGLLTPTLTRQQEMEDLEWYNFTPPEFRDAILHP